VKEYVVQFNHWTPVIPTHWIKKGYTGLKSFSLTLYLNGVPPSLLRSYVPSSLTFATVYGPAPVSKISWFKITINQDRSHTFHAPCAHKPDALILTVECWESFRQIVRFTVGNRPEFWNRRAVET
jgi:hypothetical protein